MLKTNNSEQHKNFLTKVAVITHVLFNFTRQLLTSDKWYKTKFRVSKYDTTMKNLASTYGKLRNLQKSHASLTLNHCFDELHSAADEHVGYNINYYNLQINNKLDNHCLITSSVASPVCQEGHFERTFSTFAFSSRFFLFFPDFSWFFPSFSRFLSNFSLSGVALCPLWPLSGYATVNNIDCAPIGCAILLHLSCEAHHLTCWYKYTFH